MTLETSRWIANKVPEFAGLSEEEREAIQDFSFLWSLFEGSVLSCQCNVREIRQFAQRLEVKNGLCNISFDHYVAYLQNRYFVNGSLTNHYQHLYIERSGSPEEVEAMLRNDACPNSVKLVGCLVVIFRLRNNLFHGEKWQYQLQGQLDNFRRANAFLRSVMDSV